MAETPLPSPEGLQLRGAPATSARLSPKAVIAVGAVLAVLMGLIVINLSKEKPKPGVSDTAPSKDLQPALGAARDLTRDVPDVQAAPTLPPTPPQQVPQLPPPQYQPPPAGYPAGMPAAPQRSIEDEARLADSGVPKFADSQAMKAQQAFAASIETAPEDSQPDNGADRALRSGSDARQGPGAAAGRGNTLEADLNGQTAKLAFSRESQQSFKLGARVRAAASPFELKTGTVIPSILIGEVNSDLPGEIVAQVAQNVYDTGTGSHLLIPQGARLFGRYDSRVSFGQSRALVVWERLIFPDASTLDLGGMPGDDQGGNAGLADLVNNHYLRIFGAALLTSVFSAGYQLSQPQQSAAATGGVLVESNQQVAAAAVGQQMAELGAEIARRNMEVQPTIQIRKGYRLNVMVNKDVVFPGSYEP